MKKINLFLLAGFFSLNLLAQHNYDNQSVIYSNNGNVGIGTSSPGKALDVNGDILLRNYSGLKQIYTWNSADENWRIGMNQNPGFTRSMSTSHVQYLTYSTAPGQGFAVGVNGGNSSFEIRGSDHSAFFRGNVGIGTTTTGSHELAVEGSIGAREIRVEVGAWSDFVFKKDYTLPTLDEVENHIKANGHLKDIPSEAEVKANGINLGEMDAKLLQKIEELMLYTIEQQKRIEAIHQELSLIKKENKSLRNTVAHLKNK